MSIIKTTRGRVFRFAFNYKGRQYIAEAECLRPFGLPTVVALDRGDNNADAFVLPGAFAEAEKRAREIFEQNGGGA
jgi:hypothetical protein